MSSHEIENSLEKIIGNLNRDDFIYEFLIAYGISKSVVTRLKKGDQNRSKRENEVLYPKKMIFRIEKSNNLLNAIDDIGKDASVQKHSPRFAIMTDFKQLVAKDLKLGKALDIKISELPRYYGFFLPLAGSEVYYSPNDHEADRDAAYKMATLYDHLIDENPEIYQSDKQIHHLNVFLSRLLFCFFAEDTGIFEEDSIFTNTLAQHTDKNGSDTHIFLDKLFSRLDSKSSKGLPEFLAKFPYVNGGLFKDKIASPVFTAKARKILVELGGLQWKNINPDIFGSMIQAVTTGVDRSKLGQHYTSVPNILKLIKPLFLDEFYEELEKANTVNQLFKLQCRIANAKFFDPACGSGNFLIITYKELRVLEIEIIKKIIELSNENMLNTFASQIKISQFYGIEIDDFAHEVAILSLWLAEHQMNIIFEERLFEYAEVASILPLKSMGNIKQGNATRVAWEKVCPITDTDEIYVVGNPPYLGSNLHSDEQRDEMHRVFGTTTLDRLDYIGTWFLLAAKYIEGTQARVAFVTTNSITQGVQVPILWGRIFKLNVFIHFAVKSFKWKNNAKGNAGVTVAIIGLTHSKVSKILLFDDTHVETVKSISPYLIKDTNTIVLPRTKPQKGFPSLVMGNKPSDDGNLILNEQEMAELISDYPEAKKFIKKFTSADDFINGNSRYCLWIAEKDKNLAKKIPPIKARTEKLYTFRSESKAKSTRDYAEFDYCFRQISFKETDGIIVPRVSSESRTYIPLAYISSDTIVSDATNIVYDAQPWLFGLLHSKMHVVWVKAVSGKLETRYRYSAKLCYNTFPFPNIDKKQQENLNQYVFDILDARANHPGKTLAWMYDSDTMPSDLKKAHQALDEAVEKCYQLKPFNNDSERLEYLFKLYEKMIKDESSNK